MRRAILVLVLVLAVAPAAAGASARGGRAIPVPPPRGGVAVPTDPVTLGRLMTAQAGWTGGEWECFFQVVDHESGWKVTAWNRQSSASDPIDDPYGAYGLPQSHPPSKLASAGADWRTSAETQLRWLIGYIHGRWTTPCAAWAHWRLFMAGGSDYSY
jgi:hypothetical protein